MRDIAAGLLCGLLFGLGLCISGMSDPAIVLGFLDIAGNWNPALLFVMGGGVTVAFLGYRFLVPKTRPLWGPRFFLPTASAIDKPLLSGAALFGIGWGLSGYCPGPAVVSLASGRSAVFIFFVAMAIGMILVRWIRDRSWATMKTGLRQENP